MKRIKRLPLERQLFLCFLAVSALVTTIALGMAFYLDIHRQQENIDAVIGGTAAFVASMDDVRDMLQRGYPSQDVSGTLDKLHRTLPEIDAISVYDQRGLRYYHTDRQEAGETFVAGEETAILNGSGPYIISGYSTFGNQRRAFHAVEGRTGEIVGFVTVSIFSSGILEHTRSMLLSFLLVMGVAILAAAALSRGIVTLLKGALQGHRPEELLDLYLRQGDVLNTLEDGVAATDGDGRVIFANDSACKMLGREREQLQGKKLADAFPATQCERVARTGQNRYRLSCAVGERQILFSESRMPGGESAPGVLVVMNDKTELRKLSDQLSGAQAMLDTLRMFNHEFMNKLHVILGYLQVGRTEEAMRYIMNSSRVSGQTIRDVADRIRVPEVCALVIGKMMYAAERDIELILLPTSQCRQEDMLLTNEEFITIVGNLLENAIEALCDGEHEVREIRLALCCRPDCSLIVCQDTGSGIPPQIRERIWEKGVSSKGDNRGFGLYLVHQLTEQNNGRIELETEEGEGTCFTLTFVKEERER